MSTRNAVNAKVENGAGRPGMKRRAAFPAELIPVLSQSDAGMSGWDRLWLFWEDSRRLLLHCKYNCEKAVPDQVIEFA